MYVRRQAFWDSYRTLGNIRSSARPPATCDISNNLSFSSLSGIRCLILPTGRIFVHSTTAGMWAGKLTDRLTSNGWHIDW